MKLMHPLPAAAAALAILTLGAFLVERGDASLRFPHERHAELECSTCHGQAPQSTAGSDNLLPTASICLECHEQYDLDAWGWEPVTELTTKVPRFSHEAHIATNGLNCEFCHGALSRPDLAGLGKGIPTHETCGTCHNGVTAGDDCTSCHLDATKLRPLNHQADYLHSHQFEARGSAGKCESCHRESELCSDCHQGENVLFLTHDRNYKFTHAQDARKNQNDCASCHDVASFCNDCHAQEYVRPTNHDSNWIGGTNRHAVEARRDIAYCAGCHESDEPNCVRCHADRTPGRGNDPNIHPSDFRDTDVEGPWHDDDAYSCYECHNRSTQPEGFCGYCHSPDRRD
jgi:hypothetical protein